MADQTPSVCLVQPGGLRESNACLLVGHSGGREISYWSARESIRWTSVNRTFSSLLRDRVCVLTGDPESLDLVSALPG